MKNIIGVIKEQEGQFYVEDSNKIVRTLEIGDNIYFGDKVFGNQFNEVDDFLTILTDTKEVIVLEGTQSLVFGDTNEQTSNLAWLPNQEQGQDVTADANTQAGDITDEETAAGAEAPTSSDPGNALFDARVGASVNITTSLRDATFSTPVVTDLTDPFVDTTPPVVNLVAANVEMFESELVDATTKASTPIVHSVNFTIAAQGDLDFLTINGAIVDTSPYNIPIETSNPNVNITSVVITPDGAGGYGVTMSVVLSDNLEHDAPFGEELVYNVAISATDTSGNQSVTETMTITVVDDVPQLTISQINDDLLSDVIGSTTLTTQDAQTIGTDISEDSTQATLNFKDYFEITQNYGADDNIGETSEVESFTLGVEDTISALSSRGEDIALVMNGNILQGVANNGRVVFDVSVDEEGNVTLKQYDEIDHLPTNQDPDQTVNLEGKVSLTYTKTITDSDNDSTTDSSTINIGANLNFADDEPRIIAEGVINAELTDTTTQSVYAGDIGTIDFGADITNATFVWNTTQPTIEALNANGQYEVVSWEVSTDGLILTGTVEGKTAITLEMDVNNANYLVTLNTAVKHAAPNSENDNVANEVLDLDFGYIVTDGDGDSAQGVAKVSINDTFVTAVNDTNSATEDSLVVTSGNVMQNDQEGADGATITAISATNWVEVPPSSGYDFALELKGKGLIEFKTDGSYIFTYTDQSLGLKEDGTPQTEEFVFNYTLTDGDKDTANATLTITATGSNDAPVLDVTGSVLTAYDVLVSENPDIPASGVEYPNSFYPTGDNIYEGSFTFSDIDNSLEDFTITIGTKEFTIENGKLAEANGATQVDGNHGYLSNFVLSGPNNGEYKVSYTYTQTQTSLDHTQDDNIQNADSGNIDKEIFDLKISDGNLESKSSITVNIVDDVIVLETISSSVTAELFESPYFDENVVFTADNFKDSSKTGLTLSAGTIKYDENGNGTLTILGNTNNVVWDSNTLYGSGIAISGGNNNTELDYNPKTDVSEALIFDLPKGEVAYGVNVSLSKFFNVDSDLDTENEEVLIQFYKYNETTKEYVLVDSTSAVSNVIGGELQVTASNIVGEFDRIVISAKDNGGATNSSDFTVSGIEFLTPEVGYIATATGEVEFKGADGLDEFYIHSIQGVVVTNEAIITLDEDELILSINELGIINATNDDNELYFSLVLNSQGTWTMHQYKEFEEVLELKIGAVDKDGDATTIDVEITGYTPVLVEDIATVIEGETITGNLFANDAVQTGTITDIKAPEGWLQTTEGSNVFESSFGTITFNTATGDYTIVSNNNSVDLNQTFQFEYSANGETSTIEVNIVNNQLIIGDNAQNILHGGDGHDVIVGDKGGAEVAEESTYKSYNMAFALDRSGSISDNDWSKVVDAMQTTLNDLAKQVADSKGQSVINVALAPFAGKASLLSFKLDGVNDSNEISKAINELSKLNTSGGTNYEDAFEKVQFWFENGATTNGEFVNQMYFMSDGEPTDSNSFWGGGVFQNLGKIRGEEAFKDLENYLANKGGLESSAIALGDATDGSKLNEYLKEFDSDDNVPYVNFDELSKTLQETVGENIKIDVAGDEVFGEAGDDLIFGDALNADFMLDTKWQEDNGWMPTKTFEEGDSIEIIHGYLKDTKGVAYTQNDLRDFIIANKESLSASETDRGGDDILYGGEGSDIIFGQGGNDTIYADDKDIVDGGEGNDTLKLFGANMDFTTLQNNVTNIESVHIDLSNGKADTIDVNDIGALKGMLSGTSKLIKITTGDITDSGAQDKVEIDTRVWTKQDGQFTCNDTGAIFDVYVNEDVTLKLQVQDKVDEII